MNERNEANESINNEAGRRFPRSENAVANPLGFPRGQLFNEKQGASVLVHQCRECKYRARYDL